MKHRRVLAVACLIVTLTSMAATTLRAQTESYDDVMLVINERSWASREIGSFFAARRSIPERNIYRMNVDTSETIDSARFVQARWQMQEWMRSRGLVDSINYIVTTKGCPLRVRTSQRDRFDSAGRLVSLGGQASFEDCIALMNGEDSTLALSVKYSFPFNRYYASEKRFARNQQTLPIYLVTRLDAYTVDQVKGYLVRAESPAILGDGVWVLDVDPTKEGNPGYRVGNDWLRGAESVLRDRGMEVVFNNDTGYVRAMEAVVGYASWGSNDAHSGGRDGAVPKNTWLNASIAETFVSTGGRTFNEGSSGGQSLIADWIAEGACGVKGYTDEPYLTAIAQPNIVFDRYTAGFNMAESYWAGSRFSAWRQVVIGDPKMKLGTMVSLSDMQLNFGATARGRAVYDTIRMTNNLGEPLLLNGLTIAGANASDFTALMLSGSLPASIAAGGAVDIVIAYSPTGYGSRAATLGLAHRRADDSRDNTIIAMLSGTVTRPSLVAPGTFDFGAVALGSTMEHVIELASSQPTDTLDVSNYNKSGTGASRFTVEPIPALPTRLSGSTTLGMRVTYSPSGATRDSAVLSVATLNGGAPVRIKLYGTGALSAAPDAGGLMARNVSLMPNPAAARTNVHFTLDRAATVRVTLLDMRGRTVRTIADGTMAAGDQQLSLDVSDLSSGSYLCRVEITNGGESRTHVEQIIRR